MGIYILSSRYGPKYPKTGCQWAKTWSPSPWRVQFHQWIQNHSHRGYIPTFLASLFLTKKNQTAAGWRTSQLMLTSILEAILCSSFQGLDGSKQTKPI